MMSLRSKLLAILSGFAIACAVIVATPAATSQANAATSIDGFFSIVPNGTHPHPG